MAGAVKLFPGRTRHQMEDLFQVLIDKELVSLTELERESARVRVQNDPQIQTSRALGVYGQVGGRELHRTGPPLIPSAAPKSEED